MQNSKHVDMQKCGKRKHVDMQKCRNMEMQKCRNLEKTHMQNDTCAWTPNIVVLPTWDGQAQRAKGIFFDIYAG